MHLNKKIMCNNEQQNTTKSDESENKVKIIKKRI